MYDLIIIGASAAGISASIYAARRRLNFKVIAKDIGGEVSTSGEIENWPGIIHTNGIKLAEQFKKHADANNVIVDEGKTITAVEKDGNVFVVSGKKMDGSDFKERARSVLISTGVHPKELNVPGEKEYKNKGVSYCSVCDGPLFAGRKVAVIGGGNSALESALMLAEIASKVYLINKNPKFKGEQVLIDKVIGDNRIEIIYQALTSKITGENFVTGMEYTDKNGQAARLSVDGVFVHIGRKANSGFVPGLELNEVGEIKVDTYGRTNVPGLFAAGDVTDIPYKQIIIAAGQGVTALLSAVDYLNKSR